MKVIAIQQSNDGKGEPYEVVWGRDLSEAGVFLCIAQLIEHSKDESPWAPRLLKIEVMP